MANLYEKGYLAIGKEEDRILVASILYKNGYSVSPTRIKRDGKSYTYLVGYELKNRDLKEDVIDES